MKVDPLQQKLAKLLDTVQFHPLAQQIRDNPVDLKFYKKVTDYLLQLLPNYQYIPSFESKTLVKNKDAIEATQELMNLINNSPLQFINNWLMIDKIKLNKGLCNEKLSKYVSLMGDLESYVKKGGVFDLIGIKKTNNLYLITHYTPIRLLYHPDNTLSVIDGVKRILAIKNAGRRYLYMSEFELTME